MIAPNIQSLLADLATIHTHDELAALIAQETSEPICKATVGRYIDGSRQRIPFTVGWAVIGLHKRNARRLQKK